jgi:tRNA-modifying protein YgfZ
MWSLQLMRMARPGEMCGEFERQHAALRDGCGLVSLDDWSSITLTGTDRQKFLHNFCTNDIKRLQPRDACEAFFLNVKGKILGHGFVACREDETVVFGEPGQAETLIAHLDRYLIREDVQLCDTTAERSFLLVAGGAAAKDALERVGVAGGRIVTKVYCALLESEVECVVETATRDREEVVAELVRLGALVANEAFEIVRIEAGLSLFGIDYSNENLPQEVGRDRQAISFTKGCYLGQETVARIDALGHVNQRIVGVRFIGNAVPDAGFMLEQNSSGAGRVTSAASSLRLKAPLALAMVRSEVSAVGTQLDSSAGECEVVALPLLG